MPGKAVAHAATPFIAQVISRLKSRVRLERREFALKLRQIATGIEPVDDDTKSG
jgi:hypothetical protein